MMAAARSSSSTCYRLGGEDSGGDDNDGDDDTEKFSTMTVNNEITRMYSLRGLWIFNSDILLTKRVLHILDFV